ncbi:adenosine deaminase [Streptococcus pacificus]|uniref:Adenosine deaminase n=1 Tax=Streptococcus pacificus TaxID=2740577 RepID=A0ABS0ZJU7_9STRE|nr:adenosine deaminase [Streptococcus pacificus]MBJ8325983.1 adenosine deaminase [Streptococcus pacificus]
MTNNKWHHLKKVELHCHLDGSLSLEAIRQLAAMASIAIPSSDDALRRLVTVTKDSNNLIDYLKTFDFIRPLLQTKEALSLAAYDVVKQAAKENVIYIEVRFAPELSMDQTLSALETVDAVLDGLNRAMKDYDVIARLLVCGLKQSSKTLTEDIFKEVVRLSTKGLVGFDFAGNEADFPTSELKDIIKTTQDLGLPLTFHAGECHCPNNISYGIDLGIKRFGHVTALYQQPELIKAFIASDATAEMCLTSNLQTKAARNIAEFPYQLFYEAGLKMTINTDNRTVSNTNLTKEYALYHQYFNTTISDFYHFNQHAILASFTTNKEKAHLLKLLKENYEVYLS